MHVREFVIDLSGSLSIRQLELVIPPPRKIRARVTIDGAVVYAVALRFEFKNGYRRTARVPADGDLELDLYGEAPCTITVYRSAGSRTGSYRKQFVIVRDGDVELDFSTDTDFVEYEK